MSRDDTIDATTAHTTISGSMVIDMRDVKRIAEGVSLIDKALDELELSFQQRQSLRRLRRAYMLQWQAAFRPLT